MLVKLSIVSGQAKAKAKALHSPLAFPGSPSTTGFVSPEPPAQEVLCSPIQLETIESTTAPLALLCPASHRSLFLSCTSISLSLRFLISLTFLILHSLPFSPHSHFIHLYTLSTLTSLHLCPFPFPISLLLCLNCHFLANHYHYLSQNPYF